LTFSIIIIISLHFNFNYAPDDTCTFLRHLRAYMMSNQSSLNTEQVISSHTVAELYLAILFEFWWLT